MKIDVGVSLPYKMEKTALGILVLAEVQSEEFDVEEVAPDDNLKPFQVEPFEDFDNEDFEFHITNCDMGMDIVN